MKTIYYALIKRAFVNEEGQMTDEIRITYHTDINEIYWFKGKHNYNDEDYYICELVEEYGELVYVENSELNY